MDVLAIFGLQLIFSILVWSLIAKWVVSPELKKKTLTQALFWLTLPHAFRHVGMAFLVPGIVSESLGSNFALPTAFGDLLSAVLALSVLTSLKSGKMTSFWLVWLFNIVGTVDLMLALSHAEAVPLLHAGWFIPTMWVPLLLVTHFMIFVRLTRKTKD